MAVVSVSFDGTNTSLAQSETDGGIWDKYHSNQSPTQETGFVWNGNTNISEKITGTSSGGVEFEDGATVNYTTGPSVVLSKIMFATPGIMDTSVAKGFAYEFGSGASGANYYGYFIDGLYAGDYPILKSWRVFALDPNEVAWRDEVVGTPSLTAADYYALYVATNAAAKVENLIHARVDYLTNGTGLTLVGGDGASADGVFQDFLDYDFGTTTNRMGVVIQNDAEIIVNGVITIGSATATEFTDSNQILVFPHHLVGDGFSGLDIDLQSASTTVTIADTVFKSLGQRAEKLFFNTFTDVDGTNDEVDYVGHGHATGNYMLYSKEGGTDAIGLTDATYYFVRAVTADALAFFAVGATVGRQNSFTNTSRINLTAASTPGESHSLIRDPDTRSDLTISGTSGSASLDGCSFLNFRNITFTSAASMDGGRLECKLLTQNSADISNVTIVTSSDASIATLQDPVFGTTTDLHDAEFIQDGQGHALKIDTATSYTLTNITFTGYGATASDSAAIDVTATSGTVTLNISGGTSPTYKTAGATVVVQSSITLEVNGVTEGATCTMEAIGGGPETDGTMLLTGTAGATGKVTNTGYNYIGNQSVDIEARQVGARPYKATGLITGADLIVTAVWQEDEIAEP